MALAKLMAYAAGGAVIGGGAVHVAEAPAAQTQYVKRAKRVAATPVKGLGVLLAVGAVLHPQHQVLVVLFTDFRELTTRFDDIQWQALHADLHRVDPVWDVEPAHDTVGGAAV